MYFLLCLAAASLVASRTYSVKTFAPGTTVDALQLHAANEAFHTALSGPLTSCTLVDPSECPPVVGTFVLGPMEALAAVVPGGQGIYVQPNGEVKFGRAHANILPPDAIVGVWQNRTTDKYGSEIVVFDDGNGHDGLALCYEDSEDIGTLYAKTEGSDVGSCDNVVGLTLTREANVPGAFQYD